MNVDGRFSPFTLPELFTVTHNNISPLGGQAMDYPWG